MTLLVNACTRKHSRTSKLAEYALKINGDDTVILNLYDESLTPLDEKALRQRDELIEKEDFSHPMFRCANLFKNADEIIIAAPYWDLSFPAVLKVFIENICICGLTFRYTEHGVPKGLCKAKRLVYITTAGGFIPQKDFGFGYIDELCKNLFGIQNTDCIKAEGLDIIGADEPSIMKSAYRDIDKKTMTAR